MHYCDKVDKQLIMQLIQNYIFRNLIADPYYDLYKNRQLILLILLTVSYVHVAQVKATKVYQSAFVPK